MVRSTQTPQVLGIEFEKAVRLLARRMPPAEDMRKPTLFHGIRVGVSLYHGGYPRQIILAGLLHDAIEFAGVTEQELEEEFGSAVAILVLANTKDDSIGVPADQTDELIKRCARNGQEALIVKAADILDSFQYYSQSANEKELEYCRRNAVAILKYKPPTFQDAIFTQLGIWLQKDKYAQTSR